ncbi:MAG: hypothetical protein ACI395_01215 [Candidatus Cryptobacteroides sp.]
MNFYAFLLLFCGVGIGVVPLYRQSLWLIIPQAVLVMIFIRASISIFSSWKHKKREYSILYRKNEKEIRPSSFSDYIQAPCGRLLTLVVLKDLGQLSAYKSLKLLRKPLKDRLKEGCSGSRTVVRYKVENVQ